MRYITVFLPLLLFGNKSEAQTPATLSAADSQEIVKTWNTFQKAVQAKDTNAIRSISLPNIYCNICLPWEQWTSLSNYVLIDTFLNQLFDVKKDEALSAALHNKTYRNFSARHLSYDSVEFEKSGLLGDIIRVEVFLDTTPEGWGKEEGREHLFQFVKVQDKFRFFGFMTIP